MPDLEMGVKRVRGEEPVEEEEEEETDYRPVNWKKVFLSPKYIPMHLLLIAMLVLTILMTVRHAEIVEKLRPFSEKVRDTPGGWLIPIGILILISFPPLFGHEIVALLCGIVYGLWVGFGIVAAGTFFGEVGTWFAFKYALRKKACKMERTNLTYGAMARLTRDGGFWIVLAIRFSIIPSHISTAVFSTCNVRFWYFALATFLTLPKQIILVYLGVLFVQQQDDTAVKASILAIAAVVTIAIGVYLWMKMAAVKKTLLFEQEERKAGRDMDRFRSTENLDDAIGPMASFEEVRLIR